MAHSLRCIPRGLAIPAIFGPGQNEAQRTVAAGGPTTRNEQTSRGSGLVVASTAPFIVVQTHAGHEPHTYVCPAGTTVLIFDRHGDSLIFTNTAAVFWHRVSVDALRQDGPEE